MNRRIRYSEISAAAARLSSKQLTNRRIIHESAARASTGTKTETKNENGKEDLHNSFE